MVLTLGAFRGVRMEVKNQRAQPLVRRVLVELGVPEHVDGVDLIGRHRGGAADQLFNEFFGDRRQRRHAGCRRLLLARHRCSCSSCYASNTKFVTGSQ